LIAALCDIALDPASSSGDAHGRAKFQVSMMNSHGRRNTLSRVARRTETEVDAHPELEQHQHPPDPY
jgi:hypothetical protein